MDLDKILIFTPPCDEFGELLRDMAGLMGTYCSDSADVEESSDEVAPFDEAFAPFDDDPLLFEEELASFGEDSVWDIDRDRKLLYDCMRRIVALSSRRGFYGNLWHDFLTLILVESENAYSLEAEMEHTGSEETVHDGTYCKASRDDGYRILSGTVGRLALHDMAIFEQLYDYDFSYMIKMLDADELSLIFDYETKDAGCKKAHFKSGDKAAESDTVMPDNENGRKKERSRHEYNSRIRDRICHLADEIARGGNAAEMLETLTLFYREYGVGKFGLHKAFRIDEQDGRMVIAPIRSIRHVKLSDLVGYELAKEKLIENTEAFLDGRPANNCLLYGDAGTGKSSSIKALANQYFDRGLRIIEVYRHQFRDLNHVISEIKSRNYRFIIYMDDLSFEDFETDYKYLKAVIEGGLEKKPENVLIYATSNRRHLIRESFSDKKSLSDDDIHKNDTVQEKLSLSARFGISIYFGAPEPDEYDEIVRELAERAGIDSEGEEFRKAARAWAMRHGGLSGRTATQYIDHLAGTFSHSVPMGC